MSITIAEWFGYSPNDSSGRARELREQALCPFTVSRCIKVFNDRTISGVCSVVTTREPTAPIHICPHRLYAHDYGMLRDVAKLAFGRAENVVHLSAYASVWGEAQVVAIPELRLPSRGRGGAYFVDWILARVSQDGTLVEFTAVEVQTIDTTGTYRPEVERLRSGSSSVVGSKAGLNWENVNKRILPQLIYKGHLLRREPLCRRGLFFVSPKRVYQAVLERLGGKLEAYEPQYGAITFLWYTLAPPTSGKPGQLVDDGHFSTTVDQVAWGFVAPSNLPPAGSYEKAIRAQLHLA